MSTRLELTPSYALKDYTLTFIKSNIRNVTIKYYGFEVITDEDVMYSLGFSDYLCRPKET